jgi:16S rRNA (guanine527-N7)-methyltransferase
MPAPPPGGPLPHIGSAAAFAEAFAAAPETIARLQRYAELLRQWQRVVNLVASTTLEDVWHRHFADSAQLFPFVAAARHLVDLGTGGGFPGLVLAILLADSGRAAPPRVSLVESNARKCAFLAAVVRATGIGATVAVDILSTRAEAAATQASLRGADVIAARALAPLDRLLSLAAPLCTPDSVGVFLKGREVATELEVARTMWNFTAELVASRTAPGAHIVLIRQPHAKGKAGNRGRTTKG